MSKLLLQHEEVIYPTYPFHYRGTLRKPSHFPAPVDCFKNNSLLFCIRMASKIFGVKLSLNSGKSDGVCVSLYSNDNIPKDKVTDLIGEIRYRFGMDLKLEDFMNIASDDPLLAPVEYRWRGMRPSCAFSLYELLCITIVLQNAQVSRSVKMLQALLRQYGETVQFDGEELYAFWLPCLLAEVEEQELRDLKVGYRAKSFLHVSRFFANNPSFEDEIRTLPRDSAAKRLQEIYGVGPASTGYLLFESLKHLDAFNHVSPWEQKILSHLIFQGEIVPMERILDEARKRWGSWNMLAIHYLFEDLFWRREHVKIDWLEALIRL